LSESDSEDELDKAVYRVCQPQCSEESNIHVKKRRLLTWASNTSLIEPELQTLKNNIRALRNDHETLEQQHEHSLHGYEVAKSRLAQIMGNCNADSHRHKEDTRLLYDSFMKLSNAHMTRTRRSIHIKEVLEELDEAKVMQDLKLKEYERIVADALSGKPQLPRNSLPIVTIAVNEVDYTWDRCVVNGQDHSGVAADSIGKLFTAAEDEVKVCELSLADIDPFIHEENVDHSYLDTAESSDGSASRKLGPSPLQSSMQASTTDPETVLKLRDEVSWASYVDDMAKRHQALAKRKRRASATLSMSSHVYSHTPRGIRILISPLSQLEDQYLGCVYGGDVPPSSGMTPVQVPLPVSIPASIVAAEDQVIKRCLLQSVAAEYDTRVHRLRASANDWRKISSEMSSTSQTMINMQKSLHHEDFKEAVRMRHELIALGIAQATPSDEEFMQSGLTTATDHQPSFIAEKPSNRPNNFKSIKKMTPKNSNISRLNNHGNGKSTMSSIATAMTSFIGIKSQAEF
jgi:hypothetical protein